MSSQITSKLPVYRGFIITGDDPRVTTLIPNAKSVDGGIAVPLTGDSVKLLRNLGYCVDAPILHNYDWLATTPFASQKRTAAFIVMNTACFVFNAIGTGKTRAAIFAYDYMRSQGIVKKLLVVAPMSTLRVTWEKEFTLVAPHLRVVVLRGTRAKRVEALARDADVYVVNPDGVPVIQSELESRHDLDMVVVDESTAYKNKRSRRHKCLRNIVRRARRKVAMTGTPTPHSPLDAFGQMQLIRPESPPRTLTELREATMFRAGTFKWIEKRDSVETIQRIMQPAVRFTRDDCFDLPPMQYVDREVAMSAPQQKMFNELAHSMALQVKVGDVVAVNEADLINKLLQVALGVVYTTNHEEEVIDAPSRLRVLSELIEEAPSKVLVFTPYKSSLRMIAGHIRKDWGNEAVAVVSGDTSASSRDKIFGAFQLSPTLRVIVAHPACMAHGLTLTEASTIVWFGPPLSLELYEQANGRVTRFGQKHSQLVVHILSSKIEDRIYKRLRSRAAMQGVLLDMYERQKQSD